MDTLNAAAFRNVQSATLTETPLSDAGVNGRGEIIQVRVCVMVEMIIIFLFSIIIVETNGLCLMSGANVKESRGNV